ncbi:hypothetical protein GH714_043877 [Hevea brasiliensis]|uniref:Protein kinase domain-containing protein n=1 Tax=Hevea brasiliensis TaxID=3981 RepID=A0A6A6K2E1_HEVBR|nr:hypothetical protein GH714_043877 [Hevea brasiliensis]
MTWKNSALLAMVTMALSTRAGEKAILMEYMDPGTLDTLLKANGPFPETLLAHIAHQALNGLSYLHACKIVHLDIKPSNLLVNKDMKLNIGDFGVSRIVHGSTTSYDNLGSQGTYAYTSPERLDSETFGSSSEKDIYAGDVWSLGVTLWELSVGHFPFFTPGKRPSWMEVAMVICFGEFPSLPKQASHEFGSFLKCCLERAPSKRWTVSQLLSHPFICMEREPNRLLSFTHQWACKN